MTRRSRTRCARSSSPRRAYDDPEPLARPWTDRFAENLERTARSLLGGDGPWLADIVRHSWAAGRPGAQRSSAEKVKRALLALQKKSGVAAALPQWTTVE